MIEKWLMLVAVAATISCGGGGSGTGNDQTSSGGSDNTGSGAGSSVGGAPANGGAPATGGGGNVGTGANTGTGGGSGGTVSTGEYFVSPTGSDSNPGTREQPFRTLTRAHSNVSAGNTIWMLPGVHPYAATIVLQRRGADGLPIRIASADGARAVLDFATQPRGDYRGIEINGDYWHIQGLEIKNAADNGILISSSNNVVEDVIFHHNDDTGLQILVPESQATNTSRGANNLILNCDSYDNWDGATNGENADGFAAKLRIGAGNVFRGCRAYNNADDGYDLYAADDVVLIEDSWATLNGTTSRGSSPSGDGNGFKLGGEPNGTGQGGARHVVTRASGFDNQSCGFTRNNNPDAPVLSECGVGANDDGNYCDGLSCANDFTVSVSGTQARSMPRNADGSLPSLR